MLRVVKLLSTWQPVITTIRNFPYPTPFIHFLKNLPPTQYTKLANGLTVATEERECFNACIGLYIDGGARYESDFENGLTHFFEHIAFKGTKSRKKTVLEEQMSMTGARFKCITTREIVCYYAECLCQDTPLVLDILTDCVFNNNYSAADIEQQKKTVYQEMIEHDKNTNEVLFDYLHSTAFQGTPLAQTVMGPSCNLYNFKESTIARYLKRVFEPSRTVLAAVGGITHDQIVTLAKTYLSKVESTKCIECNVYRYTGSELRYRDDNLPLANVAVAVEAPSLCQQDKVVMDVAASIVGGWDRSQGGGLNNANPIAQAASSGLCDAYKAFHINYNDTGLWGCQFMSPSLQLEDMLLIIQDQWMHMCNTITDVEVERAKRDLKTKLLSLTESSVGVCHEIGQWTLYSGSRPELHESICAIDRVYANQIKEVCTEYLYDKCPAVAAVGPTEGLSDYTRIRAGMYWLRI
ncbi:hypothetical protein K1T71_000376 [Dendrolimus kikuchii]|uniref:Uncharacterized protein n=1 Tax=Dendrolimus kikuchii TaxID=765133 RepID=A0ACC1DJ18_9NEOP|nr:hypothetical protein K1T71_000376 [Dendrolimus kikuchii]